jgi:hypothetical protein
LSADLVPLLSAEGILVTLAQPNDCYTSGPFLRRLNRTSLLSPLLARDPKKLETFILTKAVFAPPQRTLKEETQERIAKEGTLTDLDTEVFKEHAMAMQKQEDLESWGGIVSLRTEQLSQVELEWLRRELKGFPETATMDSIRKFFEQHLGPLVVLQ